MSEVTRLRKQRDKALKITNKRKKMRENLKCKVKDCTCTVSQIEENLAAVDAKKRRIFVEKNAIDKFASGEKNGIKNLQCKMEYLEHVASATTEKFLSSLTETD